MGYSIQVIPEKSNVLLSRDVYDYMLMQVPQGRLTRRSDIEQHLAKRFCVHHVMFDLSTNMYIRHVANMNDYIYAILDQVPMHREVTARGYIVHSPDQVRWVLRFWSPYGRAIAPGSGTIRNICLILKVKQRIFWF